ncbi:MAG: hypothetical protein ACREC0_15315 [Methylocella sp.]
MAILLIWSVLLGAILGRFCKVLILVPAGAFVLVVVLVRSAAFEHGLLQPLLEFAMLNATLQIGYVSGLISFIIPGVSQRQEKPAHVRPLLRR